MTKTEMMRTMSLAMTFLISSLALASSFPAQVVPGIERLDLPEYSALLSGKRVGVLAHSASRTRDGIHVVDLLFARKDLKLTEIFSPEHGFRSIDDNLVPDSTDPVTGLPVYSLYGPRKAPEPAQWAAIDVLVIDLQDVGVRFYTYASTVALALESAKKAGKSVIILDRPNPAGGVIFEGAVLDPALAGGLTAMFPVATRHGMTLGELAVFYNHKFSLEADLTVVPMQGWLRDFVWQDTGLPWRASSPALVAADQAQIYSIFGVLESLNIAVGRGVDNRDAFRVYGAPWVTPQQSLKLARHLNALRLPGIQFETADWIATRDDYAGQECRGFRISQFDLKSIDAHSDGLRVLLKVMRALSTDWGLQLDFSQMAIGLGETWIIPAVQSQQPIDSILVRIQKGQSGFIVDRNKSLIYPSKSTP